jgi:hypothetical protein
VGGEQPSAHVLELVFEVVEEQPLELVLEVVEAEEEIF